MDILYLYYYNIFILYIYNLRAMVHIILILHTAVYRQIFRRLNVLVIVLGG